MDGLLESQIGCPYCGEIIDVLIDASVDEQQYIEDCQVCCRPIIFVVRVGADGRREVSVRRDDDA